MIDDVPPTTLMKINSSKICVLTMLLAAVTVLAEDDAYVAHVRNDASERRPLQTMVPIYPERALRDRIQGEVEVCFDVDREGRVSRVAVRHSSNRLFEKPAMLAVRASSYMPVSEHKVLSGIKTCRTFRFLLDPVAIEDPGEALIDAET